MKIFLIRHGDAIRTEKDIILTKKGITQAKKVAKVLCSFLITKVYVSTATRAQQTFEEYRKLKPEIPFVNTADIKEIYRLIVGGSPKEGTNPSREKEDRARVKQFFENMKKLPENDNIVLFTHGNVIRYLLAKVLDIPPEKMWQKILINSGSISMLETQNGFFYIMMLNNIAHLPLSETESFYKEKVKEEEYFP